MEGGRKFFITHSSITMSPVGKTTDKNEGPRSFSIQRYYVDCNIKLLGILGMWNPYKDTRKYWIYNCYTFMVLSTILGMRLVGLANNVWMVKDDLVTLMRPLNDFLSFSIIVLKYVNLLIRKSDVIILMDILNWERRISCTRENARHRNKLLTVAVQYAEFSIKLVIGVSITYTALFFILTIDLKNLEIDNLLLSSTPLKIIFQPFNNWIALLFDYTTWTLFVCMFFSIDILFLNIMLNISTQLEILNFRLRNCLKENSEKTSIEFGGNSREIYFEHFEYSKDEQFSPNKELIIGIQHYNQIYRMVKILGKILQLVLLPQLTISLFYLSVLGFTLSVGLSDEPDIATICFDFMDLVAVYMQLLIFCLAGHSVILSSDRVCSAAYETQWYNADKEFQTNLIILQSLVMNPMVISAIGLFDLSAITFKNILIKSYSTVALLRQMYENSAILST